MTRTVGAGRFLRSVGCLVMSYIALLAFIAAAYGADDTAVRVIAWGLSCQQFARMLKVDIGEVSRK